MPGPACSIPATPAISVSGSPSSRHPSALAMSPSFIGQNSRLPRRGARYTGITGASPCKIPSGFAARESITSRTSRLQFPHNQLTVITGVSGSGKSSLAFDTIYAEGQRRYVESLSAYARQFLERMEKPEVDDIDGIAPAVAIRQKNTSRNPRSTVATATECYDFLRLLYARVGRTFCPQLRHRACSATPWMRWPARCSRSPQVRVGTSSSRAANTPPPQALRDHLFDLRKKGFNRLFQAGRLFEFSTPESLLDIDFCKPVFALVDRIAIGPGLHQRVVDSVEICYREAGEVLFDSSSGERAPALQREVRLQDLRHGVRAIPNRILFSFNTPFGACPRCQGFGNTIDFDMDRVIPDKSLSIEEGAVEPWTKPKYRSWLANFRTATRKAKFASRRPFTI